MDTFDRRISANLERRISHQGRWKSIITLILLLSVLYALIGCATLAPLLDTATDPRLLSVINTLRDLIATYRLRLQSPDLVPTSARNHRDHLDTLEHQIEAQLQILETIGYTHRAKYWRKELGIPLDGYS